MGPEDLRKVSALLDEVLQMPDGMRDAWLATLQGDEARLSPFLRRLLATGADAKESFQLLGEMPAFTAPAAATPASGFGVGDRVGPYRLVRELGHGGMGEVWLADRIDGQLSRRVALKLPTLGIRRSVLVQRFARERDILAGLEHPHIARLYDAGVADAGQPYLALEYVEGQPIDRYCREHSLGLTERLRVLLQVAEAVAFAHSRLVLHRDLKPANILVTEEGHVRLLDFGIAKLMEGESADETALTLATGRALTIDYASPEQIRGQGIGTASDVYSLGVVAFELLVGVRPYRLKRGSVAEIEEAITGQQPPSASSLAVEPGLRKKLRGDLDAILNKALQKEVCARYATIDTFAQDLRRHLEGVRVFARPDTLGYRLIREIRRYRIPLGAGAVVVAAFALAFGFGATALVVAALLAGLGAALWQARRASEQARVASEEARTVLAVQEFLEGIFRTQSRAQSDPLRARQRTAKELLHAGAERITDALRDAPRARLRVLKTLADMHVDIGEFDRAEKLLGQRAEAVQLESGRSSAVHVEALAEWAELLVIAQQPVKAREILARADECLAAMPVVDLDAQFALDLAYGELYRYSRDGRGLVHAERAREQAMRQRASSARTLQALLQLGAQQGLNGKHEEARATLQRAIDHAASVPEGEARLPSIHEEAAMLDERLGDTAGAKAHLMRALAIESRLSEEGSVQEESLLRQLARLQHDAGEVHAAIESYARARACAERWPEGPDRAAELWLLNLLEGRAWRDYGHIEKAQALFANLDEANGAADIDPRLFVLLLFSRCGLALDLGRFDDSALELDRAQSAMEAKGLDGADLRFVLAQTAVALALARGDVNAARSWIERYLSVYAGNSSQPWIRAFAAEIAVLEGDLAEAERAADDALRAVESATAFRRAPWLRMRVLRVHAGIRLRQGRAGEALRYLEQAHAQSNLVHDSARHVDAAAIRVQLGLGALQLGDVSRARAEANAAAAIYATHPALAPRADERLRQLWMQLETAS